MKESLQSLVLVALNTPFAPLRLRTVYEKKLCVTGTHSSCKGLHQRNIVATSENRLMLSHFQGLRTAEDKLGNSYYILLSGNFIQENCGFHDPAENLL